MTLPEKKRTLYVSDLDGTLLGADSRVSAFTASMLDEMITHRNILFTIATARTPATVVPIMSAVQSAALPFIVIGGAAWWSPIDGNYTCVNAMSHATVLAVDEVMSRHGLRPFIYCRAGSWLYSYHYGAMSEQETRFVSERTGLRFKQFVFDDPYYIEREHDTVMMYSMNRYAVLRDVRDDLIAAAVDCEVTLYHDIVDSDVGYLEVYSAGVTKAAAIMEMARHVQADRVVVFGDNRNDIPMMRVADVSVAMGNAFDEVKNVATVVTGNNTDDAVARWIAADIAL